MSRRWHIGQTIDLAWDPRFWRNVYFLRSTHAPSMLYDWVLCLGPLSIRRWHGAGLRFRKWLRDNRR